mgnify:CR=1 FL=1
MHFLKQRKERSWSCRFFLVLFNGLRRSEAVGLKWDAIDFEENTIVIRHTVTQCNVDGKKVIVASDTTKTKSSRRTLPLVPFVKERLLALKRGSGGKSSFMRTKLYQRISGICLRK